jgi:hypothetical protein
MKQGFSDLSSIFGTFVCFVVPETLPFLERRSLNYFFPVLPDALIRKEVVSYVFDFISVGFVGWISL